MVIDEAAPAILDCDAVVITASASQFATQSAFKERVVCDTVQALDHHDFVYTDVPTAWGSRYSNYYTTVFAIVFTSGPYRTIRKEPDYFLRPDGLELPTVAVETGWSESQPLLHRDMNVLLVGGDPNIRRVFILKWTRLQSGVGGSVELWKRQVGQPIPIIVQREIVFPRPASGNAQTFSMKRRDLFGSTLLRGRNGDDVLLFDVELLRVKAAEALQRMNMTPAV
ncbi:hypothetical protein N7510_011692 [Penicillium lagena]|uniref:uncharacterized protein n=1 Tax=Penicillium lagena TaxID=94218 RepID=UPI0025424847|nr:uncharacterized protein N7510_011692 [Penicillium lagena]KAJ5602158.1 hypothetical protein N7510_011692 [Penicillium lagena]